MGLLLFQSFLPSSFLSILPFLSIFPVPSGFCHCKPSCPCHPNLFQCYKTTVLTRSMKYKKYSRGSQIHQVPELFNENLVFLSAEVQTKDLHEFVECAPRGLSRVRRAGNGRPLYCTESRAPPIPPLFSQLISYFWAIANLHPPSQRPSQLNRRSSQLTQKPSEISWEPSQFLLSHAEHVVNHLIVQSFMHSFTQVVSIVVL